MTQPGASANFETLSRAMAFLQENLAPYVERELKRAGAGWWTTYVLPNVSPLSREKLPSLPKKGVNGQLSALDLADLLSLISRNFAVAFKNKLPDSARNYAEELRSARNLLAHKPSGDIDRAQAERAIDTAALLMDGIDNKSAAAALRAMKLVGSPGLEPTTDADAGGSNAPGRTPAEGPGSAPADGTIPAPKPKTIPMMDAEVLEPPSGKQRDLPSNAPWSGTLPPWWEYATPREDVRSGRLTGDQFAADLAKVAHRGDAGSEYQDPVEFFERTYLTGGLRDFLANGLRRLSGQGGDPVIQLKTGFGGGKTHSMLALYHLAKGGPDLAKVDDIRQIALDAGAELTKGSVAVLVGTYVDATKPEETAELKSLGLALNTLWGRMAWQLGGRKAYDLVQNADIHGVAPGGQTLEEVFAMCEPCVVLIDELVAFARNLPDRKGAVPAGTLEQNMTFIQNLTETAARRQKTIVVASIPESDQEIGGPAGQKVLGKIEDVFKRVERPWTPVESSEAFEVVRRRLFERVDAGVRDQVVSAFIRHYRGASSDFPREVQEKPYEERMLSAFPFHPELFDRLYEDWNAAVPHFQSTRGVLRLLAATVQTLYRSRDSSPLIMPGTLPLDDTVVRDEFMSYLPRQFQPVIEGDIDGLKAETLAIDVANPRFQKVGAARSLARTIFLGSVPGKAVAGIEDNRVLLGAARPGESVSTYNDALGRLKARLQFLHGSEGRHWFGVHPNLNKTVTDRMGRISEDEVFAFLEMRLREDRDPGDFAAMSVAPVEADVPDDSATRLVVISPRYTHKAGTEDSPAITWAKGLAATRGTSPRLNRNMLVFAAFDEEQLGSAVEQARTYLAWDSITRDQTHLNLDQDQAKQAAESKAAASRSLDVQLSEGYKWALYPEQRTKPVDGKWTVDGAESWVAQDTSRTLGATSGLGRKVSAALEHDERLLPAWSPLSLARELERWFWRDGMNHVSVKKLWEENLCRYVYFPRLRNRDVLAKAITEGTTSRDFFGYAAGFVEGRYVGLSFGQRAGSVLFDGEAVLVRRQAAEEAQPPVTVPENKGQDGVPSPKSDEKNSDPVVKSKTRFYASKKLNELRLSSSAGQIGEEVVRHLTGLVGAEVEVRIEVRATVHEGIPETVVRTVSENAAALKFETFEFYEED